MTVAIIISGLQGQPWHLLTHKTTLHTSTEGIEGFRHQRNSMALCTLLSKRTLDQSIKWPFKHRTLRRLTRIRMASLWALTNGPDYSHQSSMSHTTSLPYRVDPPVTSTEWADMDCDLGPWSNLFVWNNNSKAARCFTLAILPLSQLLLRRRRRVRWTSTFFQRVRMHNKLQCWQLMLIRVIHSLAPRARLYCHSHGLSPCHSGKVSECFRKVHSAHELEYLYMQKLITSSVYEKHTSSITTYVHVQSQYMTICISWFTGLLSVTSYYLVIIMLFLLITCTLQVSVTHGRSRNIPPSSAQPKKMSCRIEWSRDGFQNSGHAFALSNRTQTFPSPLTNAHRNLPRFWFSLLIHSFLSYGGYFVRLNLE